MKTEVVESLKKRYNLHPLMFHRSLERAKTEGELFDILEDCPKDYPLKWDEDSNRWKICKLLELE